MVDKKVRIVLLVAGLFSLSTVIMSLYSISTANWSLVGSFNIGLFQTCLPSQCVQNQYTGANSGSNSPAVYAKRFYNAAPLAIVGVFIQLIVCFLCFLTAFIYLPPKPSLTGFICPILMFIAFIFQLSALAEAAYGINLNGRSSSVFEAVLVLQVIVILLTTIAADRIYVIKNNLYV